MKKMLYWSVVLATWFCWTIVFGNYTLAAADPVIFTTDDATPDTYSAFLATLRNQLKSGDTSHGIPVLPASLTGDKQYSLVQLSNSQNKEVTFAIHVVDLYIVAYRVGINSYFLKENNYDAMKYVFKDTTQNKLKYSGSYSSLGDRLKTSLGNPALEDAISTVANIKAEEKKIKSALLCIIQMVAEATRFTYIERQVKTNFYQRFLPLYDITSRENEWGKLSKGIQNADGNKLNPSVDLQKPNGTSYTVTTVTEVKPDMGILKYVKKGSMGQSTFGDELIHIQN